VTAFGLPIGCGLCGEPAELLSSSPGGTDLRATLKCPGCEAEWLLSAQLRRIPGSRQQVAAERQRRHRAKERA
jgi:hypothetical protein